MVHGVVGRFGCQVEESGEKSYVQNNNNKGGHAVLQLVEALCYKTEVRKFDFP
jgi:hypothetical protein